jgi:cytochrome b subunit of formate dehydrogenase
MMQKDSPVFYTTVPETCGKCHPKEYSEYVESKHWKMVQKGYHEAPVCTSCHGEHGIRSRRDPLSPSWAGNITQTCSHCHESELINAKFMLPQGMVKSFLDSYHGLSGTMGDVRVANCSSCHGNHDILPSSDPRSSVNPKNLGNTCGGCHPGAEKRFITEPIHKMTKAGTSAIVRFVRNAYILLIILTLGGMIVHNLVDLYFKSTHGEPYHRDDVLTPRFTVNERIQHAALALSFTLLAYSGFALRFSDAFFAQPFSWLPGGAAVRSWTHRGAAAAFVLFAAYHLFYLASTDRGRAQLRLIFPGPRDVREFFSVILRYLGRNPNAFKLSHYTYVEKAEYWALIWGGVVMTVTGGVLLFTDSILAIAPLWVVDLAGTIHFYEAILAVGAIMVWHGYWTIFDPEYYPMNLTWLYGRPRRTLKPAPPPAAGRTGEGA